MMSFNHLKKKLLGIFIRQESFLFDRDIMHPSRDWFFVVFAGIIFLLAGGFWSVSIYSQFSNVSVTEVIEVNEGGGYQQGLVNTALLELDQRVLKYNSLKSSILGSSYNITLPQELEDSPSEEESSTVDVETEITSEPETEVMAEESDSTPETTITESDTTPTLGS